MQSELLAERMLHLPWDFSRTPTTGMAPDRFGFRLAIPALEGASPEALLVAAFAIGLHRHSGQAAIPIDVARGGGTLALDLTVEKTTCRALVEQIEEELRAGRPSARAAAGAIAWQAAESPAPRGVDLHLQLLPADRAVFVYNGKLFKRSTIERLAGRLQVLLEAIGTRLDAPIAELPLLDAAEARWLDQVGRGRSRELPDLLVHRAFELRAALAPARIALRYRDRELTYDQLNRRANQLAHHLAARGLGADARIVVCVEPGFDIAIALLGILKAGAIYIPLDPTYPAARIRAILEDTRPDLIVTNDYLRRRLGAIDAPVLALDAGELAQLRDDNPGLAIEPARTAYIYYTSGTTGKPKGILASHRNLVAYIDLARERYEIDDRDVMPAIARFSFSISMFELMSPLVAGGTLLILDRDHVLDPARLARTLTEVTFFHAGPSLLKHLLPYIERNYPDLSVFAGVRHASSGGDMVSPEVLEGLKRIFTAAEVFVIYGCSEISCMGCTYPVPRGEVVEKTYVGRPFDNVIVRVLDAQLRPLPIGAAGEIHFAGAGIVKGYLERPELTAEKFVEIDGHRFYRTGDVGRLTEDGWLEILGRNDFQIKIRGMRVELGEVEYNLRRAPGVRDAVVMAKPGPGGDKVMVGYVVFGYYSGAQTESADADRAARLAAVRRHMVDTVPDYMVPAMYVELASLPLNHNLKVDRHALPDPDFAALQAVAGARAGAEAAAGAEAGAAAAVTSRAPETPAERRLAAIWQAVLGATGVGLDDNFFALGADSLLAMQMIARVERELGVALDGMDVLREPLEVLAAICDREQGAAAAKPARARGPVPSVPSEIFHFSGGLYGVLHGAGPAADAVLICPPIGQELVRTHFVLTKLARLLAERGTPVLRFDYSGLGDSAGDSIEATPARWQRDIAAARDELVRRTGATRIAALGVRFGATLLATAGIEASRLVLWDPVCRGAAWYDEQAALHRRYLRGQQHLRHGRPPRRLPGAEEVLGVVYSDAARCELRRLAIPPLGDARVHWLATFDAADQAAEYGALAAVRGGFEAIGVDCAWNDITRLEDIVPDLGIARALAAMVVAP